MRTFAGVLAHDLPANAAEDSYDIMPYLTGTSSKPIRETVVHHSGTGGPKLGIGNGFAIRQGKWKLIHGVGPYGKTKEQSKGLPADHPAGELYDIQADPGETTNLWNKHPEIVQRLVTLLQTCQKNGRSVPAGK